MIDLVCRHKSGYWNAVSADQFGEQTAIRIGKGCLKEMTLSAELVSKWVNAFPITCTVSDQLDNIYSNKQPGEASQNLHKENMKYRRALDCKDRDLVLKEVNKYSHPLDDNRPHLYNPVSGQIASSAVNMADSIGNREKMQREFITCLTGGFYKYISIPIKTM